MTQDLKVKVKSNMDSLFSVKFLIEKRLLKTVKNYSIVFTMGANNITE